MNAPTDRNTYDDALTALRTTNPFIESLNALIASNYFTKEVDIMMLIETEDWIKAHSNKFKAIHEAGLASYEGRPKTHITACFRKHEANQKEIDLLNNTSKRLIDRYNEKVISLQKQNFSEHEISQILPFPEAEIRANAGKLAALTAESQSLWAFANDCPRFSLSLIEGIDLGYYLESAEYQLAQRAAA